MQRLRKLSLPETLLLCEYIDRLCYCGGLGLKLDEIELAFDFMVFFGERWN